METTKRPTRWISKPCKACNSLITSALVNYDPYQVYGTFQGPGYADVFDLNPYVCVLCRGCHRPKIARKVAGKVSHKHECNAKCLASKGPTCECSCGGLNHGASYSEAA